MLAVRDDRAEAFEQLVVRYQGRLLKILTHMLGSHELAEDVSQEVFLKVYRARKRYEPRAKFATWFFRIANNTALNAIRSAGRRHEIVLAGTQSGPLGAQPMTTLAQVGSSQMPIRQLAKAEMRDIIHLAIETLNERQRMAVLLNKFEGMPYADIAEAMELTPQAVKSLLFRARENLREVLQPYLRKERQSIETNHEPRL